MSISMLADALRSEAYRFTKNRVTLLWSVVFFPVFALVLGTLGQFIIQSKMAEVRDASLPPGVAEKLLATGTLNLGESLPVLAGQLPNPILILFILIGAATLYAGDYRWESWRLTTARNTRLNLILGKVGVAKLLTLVTLILMMVLGLVGEVAKGLIFDRSLGFSLSGDNAAHTGLLFVLGYVRIVQITLLGLLAAVMTRSLIATLFVPIVVSLAQAIFANFIPMLGWGIDDWRTQFLFPGVAYDTLKAAIETGTGMAADGAALAVSSLAFWCIIPLAGAIAWFSRQDLSKE